MSFPIKSLGVYTGHMERPILRIYEVSNDDGLIGYFDSKGLKLWIRKYKKKLRWIYDITSDGKKHHYKEVDSSLKIMYYPLNKECDSGQQINIKQLNMYYMSKDELSPNKQSTQCLMYKTCHSGEKRVGCFGSPVCYHN